MSDEKDLKEEILEEETEKTIVLFFRFNIKYYALNAHYPKICVIFL